MKFALDSRRMFRNVVAISVLSIAYSAHAEVIDIAWNEQSTFTKTAVVAPSKFVEVCGALDKGHSVSWRFDADVSLKFNIHYHEGKAVVFPFKRDSVKNASDRLDVAVNQDYCWMWENKSAQLATIQVVLARSKTGN